MLPTAVLGETRDDGRQQGNRGENQAYMDPGRRTAKLGGSCHARIMGGSLPARQARP